MKNTFIKIGMIALTVISITCYISLMMVGIACIRISTNLLGMIIGMGGKCNWCQHIRYVYHSNERCDTR